MVVIVGGRIHEKFVENWYDVVGEACLSEKFVEICYDVVGEGYLKSEWKCVAGLLVYCVRYPTICM